MIKRDEHTQVGYIVIVAMAATMVLIGVVLAKAGINWIAIGVFDCHCSSFGIVLQSDCGDLGRANWKCDSVLGLYANGLS